MHISGLPITIGVVIAMVLTASAANSNERSVLVAVTDVDRNSLNRADPLSTRVVSLFAEALTARRFKVVEAEALERRKRLGRRDAYAAHDWMREARRAHASADTLIALKLGDFPEHFSDGRRMRVEIQSRVYAMRNARLLHEVRTTTRAGKSVDGACDRECVAASVLEALEVAIPALVEEIAARIPPERSRARTRLQDDMGKEQPYTLDFVGFAREDMRRIDDRLKSLAGYVTHETVERNPCRYRLAFQIRSDRRRLEQNIRRLFRDLKMPEVVLRMDPRYIEASRPGCADG